jgi:hypothetical protein
LAPCLVEVVLCTYNFAQRALSFVLRYHEETRTALELVTLLHL